LSHFLFSKLESGELQQKFSQDPVYNDLLKLFQQYYDLPTVPTWDEVEKQLSSYPVPVDREAILAPVLRQYLGMVLTENKAALWDTVVSVSLSDHWLSNQVSDVARPLYKSNQAWFDKLKLEYDQKLQNISSPEIKEEEAQLARSQLLKGGMLDKDITPQKIKENVIFTRKNNLQDTLLESAKSHWMEEGAEQYASHMANLNNAEMVSSGELCLLTDKLKIDLEVYTPDSIKSAKENEALAQEKHGTQYVSEKGHDWLLRVYNKGEHWEYQASTELQAKVHNRFYPKSFDETFFENDALSGKFKIYGGRVTPDVATKIKEAVLKDFVEPPLKKRRKSTSDLNQPLYSQYKKGAKKSYFKALEDKAHAVMGKLVDDLEFGEYKQEIDPAERQVIFEFYFNALQSELSKKSSKEINGERVEAIVKEIQYGELADFKQQAVNCKKTMYDFLKEKEQSLSQSANKKPKPH